MIEVKNIEKTFGSKKALNTSSCNFNKGEVTVILGPSGSGKTTLIRCLNKLETPDSGEILFESKNINKIKASKLSQKIGMVFQGFNLFSHMSIIENLLYAPSITTKKSKDTLIKKAESLLEKLGILDKKNNFPHNLSGGQKQRVAIARCLMMDPEVIIFDEPTSALDPESIKDIVSIIEELKEKFTIIVVTHHLSFAKKIADKIIFMDKGYILTDQSKEAFFKEPNSIRARIYLESVGEF
jgi:ABC-type polar amino acid transport system ATPase subunit